MRKWIDQVPNDGILRYLDIFNREKLVVTNPKALAEILVHKSYDFIEPPHFVSGIGRILGVGLLLAEGEEHKVCLDRGPRNHCLRTFLVYRYIVQAS